MVIVLLALTFYFKTNIIKIIAGSIAIISLRTVLPLKTVKIYRDILFIFNNKTDFGSVGSFMGGD